MTLEEKIEGREILERVFNRMEVNPEDSDKVRVASFCAIGDLTEVIKNVNLQIYKPLTIIKDEN